VCQIVLLLTLLRISVGFLSHQGKCDNSFASLLSSAFKVFRRFNIMTTETEIYFSRFPKSNTVITVKPLQAHKKF
jgi:hypothetical protein